MMNEIINALDLKSSGYTAPFLIRPMREDDIEQVHAIDQVSFTMPWPASAYRYELKENECSLLWIAETLPDSPDASPTPPQTNVVGMIVLWQVLDEAHIATLAVHPDYRRMGIAKRLLAVALEAAIQLGLQIATLEVRAGNLGAQQLYHLFGFEAVGRRIRYYRDNNEDALIMSNSQLDENYLSWLQGRFGNPVGTG